MESMTQRQKTILGVLAVVVVCAIIGGVAIVIYTLQQSSQVTAVVSATTVPTNTTNPTNTLMPSPTLSPQPIDPVWNNIQATGKIRVGMSADYPPFAYIDENFSIQGYDLALIQNIGERLGFPLEITNRSFDGLINSLQLNEIDVAVAAISLTTERDKFIDFSNVYFVSEDAILAPEDSSIVINRVEDLARYRVGVQRGSVYETWIQDVLIDTGLMRPQYLVLFEKPVDAVDAMIMRNPTVDLVLADFQPAEVAVRAKPVKIIKHGLNPQLYALAIPSGAYIFQSELNNALTQMQNDGTLTKLAKEYLDIDTLLPIPTPAPTQPPVTPSACLDSFSFVQDLNYPDYNMSQPPEFGPGFTFQKGWRIRNTGTCTWNSNYILTYVGSNPPNSPVGGNPVAIQGTVEPGQTYDIFVTLTTPFRAGIYQSFWTLRAPSGLFFGERVYAGFKVVIQQTSTPQPDIPQIYSFTAAPAQINQGGCVNLSWSYGGENLSGSRIFRNGERILFDMPTTGSFTDCPPGTGQMEYRLVVDSSTGGSAVSTRLVTVLPGVQPTNTQLPTNVPTPTLAPTEAPPSISQFDAEPDQINLGEPVTLEWSFSGTSLVSARLFRGDQLILEDFPSPGDFTDTPPVAGQIEYTLIVDSEFAGSTEQTIFVTVLELEAVPLN